MGLSSARISTFVAIWADASGEDLVIEGAQIGREQAPKSTPMMPVATAQPLFLQSPCIAFLHSRSSILI